MSPLPLPLFALAPAPILAESQEEIIEKGLPTAPAPKKEEMSFGGFQKGFKDFNDGKSDNSMAIGLISLVGVIIVIGIIIHIRQRMKNKTAPDSEKKLFKELSKVVHIPFLTRLVLRWVAKTSKVEAAVLLVSQPAFDTCINKWEEEPTFMPIRKWGKRRLEKLRATLFD